jgi:hypothetical protein
MAKEFLKPRPGLIVRNPLTKEPLPADGAEVVMSSYWRRRIQDGDAVKATKKSSASASAKKEA